jgi:hypothetical protein
MIFVEIILCRLLRSGPHGQAFLETPLRGYMDCEGRFFEKPFLSKASPSAEQHENFLTRNRFAQVGSIEWIVYFMRKSEVCNLEFRLAEPIAWILLVADVVVAQPCALNMAKALSAFIRPRQRRVSLSPNRADYVPPLSLDTGVLEMPDGPWGHFYASFLADPAPVGRWSLRAAISPQTPRQRPHNVNKIAG